MPEFPALSSCLSCEHIGARCMCARRSRIYINVIVVTVLTIRLMMHAGCGRQQFRRNSLIFHLTIDWHAGPISYGMTCLRAHQNNNYCFMCASVRTMRPQLIRMFEERATRTIDENPYLCRTFTIGLGRVAHRYHFVDAYLPGANAYGGNSHEFG